MAEIPSTLDLIMRKTSGMSMSSEEREGIRREEMLKKAKGYKLKLLDKPDLRQDILNSLDNEIPEDRVSIRSALWKLLIDEMPSDESILKYLEIMEAIVPTTSPLLKEVRTALKSGVKDRIADKKKLVQKEKKRLAALGISGSAVLPKLPEDTEGPENLLNLTDKLKNELRSADPV